MRKIKEIIYHHSQTPKNMDIGVAEITSWHQQRGWRTVGYHYIIRRDGSLEFGRKEESIGAHVAGYNSHSIGICMVGDDEFNEEQFNTLAELTRILKRKYKDAVIYPHNFFNKDKVCPNFDVEAFLMYNKIDNQGLD